MNELTHIGIAIIVDQARTKTVVGIRPDGTHLAGMNEFPGGKVEPGESPEACAVREASEETGLAVTVTETWPEIEFKYTDRTVVLHPFLCTYDQDQELKAPWEWVEIKSLDAEKFPEANKGMIERLQS